MMLIFHPDKVDVHFKNEDRSIFEEFSKTILRTTKEDLTDQNWQNTTERILYEVNYARGYAKDYEDWSMKCDLLLSYQQEVLATQRDEELQAKGYWVYRECTTLEEFTALYVGRSVGQNDS